MADPHPNRLLLERFYCAFSSRDWRTMAACYADDAQFEDPVFGRLDAAGVRAMWQMLLTRAEGLSIEFHVGDCDDERGVVDWIARYTFGPTGRPVENHVRATFAFKRGRIARHEDRFELWNWSRQALGLTGVVLGWTGAVQCRIRADAAKQLARFRRHAGVWAAGAGEAVEATAP